MTQASLAPKISTTVRSEGTLKPALTVRAMRAAIRHFPDWTTPWLMRQFLSPGGRLAPLDLHEARRVWVGVRNHRLQVGVWGQGPRVLLVHGWAGSGEQFRALREALVATGYSVVSFDAPAHGANPGSTSSLPEFMACIAAVSERFGPFHTIVGHSLGATAAALQTAIHQTAAPGDAPSATHPALVLIAPMPGFSFAMDHFCGLLGIDPALREQLTLKLERQLRFAREAFELEAVTLRSQMLLIHDSGDRQVPLSFSRELGARWPNTRLLETHGLGHKRALAHPEVVREIVSFTGSVPRACTSMLDRQLSALDEIWAE